MFDIFLIDLFFIIEEFDIASYTDDSTLFASINNTDGVVKPLEETSTKLFKSFSNSFMKNSANKCHLLVITNNTINSMRVENFHITNSDFEKLLGVNLIISYLKLVISQTYVKKLLKKFMH